MHHSTLERELTKVEKWVAQSHDRITHQRVVVLQHQDKVLDGAIARAILEQLETSQRTYIAKRDQLLEEIGLRWINAPGSSPCGTRTRPTWKETANRARA
jgi:trehalose-6-phosphatase